MKITDLRDHIDKKFDHLEKRLDKLEQSRAFAQGIWKALTVVGSLSAVIIGIYLKSK